MQRLYVVFFPEMEPEDHAWVETLRATHDGTGHALLRAHFTFVFGCMGVPASVVENEMQAAGAESESIEFCLMHAVSSRHGESHYVFLCPDQGAAEMFALHARLHAGPLAAGLDREQKFMPHLTVCNTPDAEEADFLLTQLRRHELRIRGSLHSLTLGNASDGRFERLRDIVLAAKKN